MILEQFYLGCLSQASYLVADEVSRRAVVVDPRRDIEEYLIAAAERRLRIELVVLTHVHADFVPGHIELAEHTGAQIAMSELAPVDFAFRGLWDGEIITLGEPNGVSIEVLATPGHTPESITLAVRQHATDAAPTALLTGTRCSSATWAGPTCSARPAGPRTRWPGSCTARCTARSCRCWMR